jgi:hypothetical protein
LGTKSGNQVLSVTSGSLSHVGASYRQADVASQIAILTQPSTTNGTGSTLSVPPTVEVPRSLHQYSAAHGATTITRFAGGRNRHARRHNSANNSTGRVTFTDLTYTGTGTAAAALHVEWIYGCGFVAFDVGLGAQCAGPVSRELYARPDQLVM